MGYILRIGEWEAWDHIIDGTMDNVEQIRCGVLTLDYRSAHHWYWMGYDWPWLQYAYENRAPNWSWANLVGENIYINYKDKWENMRSKLMIRSSRLMVDGKARCAPSSCLRRG